MQMCAGLYFMDASSKISERNPNAVERVLCTHERFARSLVAYVCYMRACMRECDRANVIVNSRLKMAVYSDSSAVEIADLRKR